MKVSPKGVSHHQKFAERHGIRTKVARAIIRAAEEVAETGEEYSNNSSIGAERRYLASQRKFGALIKSAGFDGFEMPGLYPVLVKDGDLIHLPD